MVDYIFRLEFNCKNKMIFAIQRHEKTVALIMVDSILRQLQVGCISRIKWDCAVNLYTNFGLCKYLLKNISKRKNADRQ